MIVILKAEYFNCQTASLSGSTPLC